MNPILKPKPYTQSALAQYLNEIKDLEPLDSKREVELAQRAKNGDEEAVNELVTHNLRFVVAVAKKFRHPGMPLEDLINEGNIGLMKAVLRFDETRGFRFISYAVWWISQSIRQSINKMGRTIRLPANITESMGRLFKNSLELEQVFEREPTSEELAEISHTTINWIEDLIRVSGDTYSLDDPMSDSYNTLVDFISSEDDRPEKEILVFSLKKEIRRILHSLTEKEGQVLWLYFGLGEDEPKNLEQIGEEMDLSGERVRQIKEKSLQRLRSKANSHLLKIYLS
ncbi:MAG: RNA polymerase sigma factor RpoD/SigA [Candidatus Neomarinimicrobiota bacterium]